MKILKTLLLLIVVLLVVVVFARNFIVKIGAEQVVKKQTGLALKIEGLSIGLKETNIDIDDMRLYNPSNFPEKLMANVPDIYVDYNLPDIIKGNIHLNEIRFHLDELTIVKNKAGQINLESLKALQGQKKEGQTKEEKPKSDKKMAMQVDNLSLRVDRVVYKDYTAEENPKVQTYNINLKENHKDITNLNSVIGLVVAKALMKTPLAMLPDFGNLSGIAGGLTESLGDATKMATEAVGDAKGMLEGVTKDAGGVLDDTTGTLKDKAKGLKGLFKK